MSASPRADGAARAPKQFLLLGCDFNTGNLGVSALASGTIASILHAFPQAQIRLFDYGKEPRTYQERGSAGASAVRLVNIRFSKKVFLENNIARLLLTVACLKCVPSARLRRKRLNKNPYLRCIAEADFITSIAAGDSFSDIYRLRRLLYVALPQILVLWMNKPLILLPQTYGPFKSRMARAVARYILRRARLVFSRDQEGREETAKLLGKTDERIRFAYDMGFALEPFPPGDSRVVDQISQMKSQGTLVGLNVSGLLYGGGYGRADYFKGKTDYRELVHRLIEYLAGNQQAQVLLIPHVFNDKSSVAGEIGDNAACDEVFDLLAAKYPGRLRRLEGRFDQHEIKFIIGQCEFFLGARMHACIAALSQCVPCVSFAYSKKFLGVMKSIDAGEVVVDLMEGDLEQAMQKAESAFQSRAQLREKLRRTIPAVKETVLNLFMELAPAQPPAIRSGRWTPE